MPGTLLLLSSSPNVPRKSTTQPLFVQRDGSILYNVETAFEVRVQTQSLSVADSSLQDDEANVATDLPSTSNGTTSIDAQSTVSIWATKEANACVLSAILLKLTPLISDKQSNDAPVYI